MLYDSTIVNLHFLAEIYDDSSVEIITNALSGFLYAAEERLNSLEKYFLVDNLTEMCLIAHNLTGLCQFSAIVRLGFLSEQLNLAAKSKNKLLIAELMSEIRIHWPILEEYINYIVKHYKGLDA